MQAQLRIYDIKSGEMDDWLDLFHNKVVPMHAKYGLTVQGAWVDQEKSQFVWVRAFEGDGTVEEQEAFYRNSPERAEVIGDEPKRFIEHMDVRELQQVIPVAD